MKANFIATAAIAGSLVSAQSTTTASGSIVTPSPGSSTSTYTEYYNTCTSSTQSMVTATTTETYCPICTAMGMTTYPGGAMTTYTTVYKAQCPTGIEDKTYTITEPCPSAGFENDHTPQGFVVTTAPCGCPANTPVAITTPGPAYIAAAQNAPAAAPAAPTPGSAPAGAPPAAPAAAAPAGPPAGPAAVPAQGAPAPAASAGPPAGPAAAPAQGAPAPAAPVAPGAASGPGAAAEAAAAGPAGSPGQAPAAAAPPPYPVAGAPVVNVAAATGTGVSNTTNVKPFTGSAATTSAFPMSFVVGLIGLVAPFIFLL